MSRSISVVTGFELNASPFDVENSLSLKVNNNLIIFCPSTLCDFIAGIRQKYDPNLEKTHIQVYSPSNDAQHLYYNNLKQIFSGDENKIYSSILKLNRLAFIRDMGMINPFKASHFLWIDHDYKNNLPEVKNLEICIEKVIHFCKIENNGTQKLCDQIFIIPQEMAWAYYYWNKLEHRPTLGGNVLLEYSDYFEKLTNKLPNIVEVKTEEPVLLLMQAKEFIPLPVEKFDKSLVVVVNHYQYDTSWVSRLNHPAVVYNKNPNHTHLYDINLPNLGFDTIVYLRYIIDNYDNLPDYICFLQDDPFFHCMDVIQIVNNFKFDKDFVPMSTSYYLGGHDWKMSEDYAERVGLQFQRPLKMITSCQCIVSKERVLKREKSFYELLVSTIDKQVKSSENYAIENLWPTILSFNEDLIPCINCKGHGDNQ